MFAYPLGMQLRLDAADRLLGGGRARAAPAQPPPEGVIRTAIGNRLA